MRRLDIQRSLLIVFLIAGPPLAAQSASPDVEETAQAARVSAESTSGRPLSALSFVGTFLSFTETNPGSGVKPNQWGNTAQIELGADLNLDEALHWKGATLQVRESFFAPKYNASLNLGASPPSTETGHFWGQDVGSTLVVATFQDLVPASYLSQFTLEQKFGKRLDVQIGRSNPSMYFDQPINCDTILSCPGPLIQYDNDTLPPALATWEAVSKLEVNERDSFKAGISQVDFQQLSTSGFDWSSRSGSGAFLAAEYAHRETFMKSRRPTFLTAGVWHDTSTFSDPATSAKQKGSTAVYARFEKPLWRTDGADEKGKPHRFLTTFGTTSSSFSSAQPFRAFADGGLNLHGLQRNRVSGHYGVKLSYLRINTNELEAEQTVRQKLSGVSFRSSNDQFRAELNAHIAIKGPLFIEPSLAYVFNANVQIPTVSAAYGKPKGGFTLGFVVFLNIRSLFP